MMSFEFLQESEYEEFFGLFCEWDKSREFDKAFLFQTLDQQKAFGSEVLLAKDEDGIVGYVQMAPGLHLNHEPYLEVVQILVSEKRRSQGIGEALMRKVEEIAWGRNLKVVKLSSRIQRSKAHVFYEELGYEMEKVSKFYKKNLRVCS